MNEIYRLFRVPVKGKDTRSKIFSGIGRRIERINHSLSCPRIFIDQSSLIKGVKIKKCLRRSNSIFSVVNREHSATAINEVTLDCN